MPPGRPKYAHARIHVHKHTHTLSRSLCRWLARYLRALLRFALVLQELLEKINARSKLIDELKTYYRNQVRPRCFCANGSEHLASLHKLVWRLSRKGIAGEITNTLS